MKNNQYHAYDLKETALEHEERLQAIEDVLWPRKSSGIDGDAGDWTQAGQDASGFPVPKGSPEDVTPPVEPAHENENPAG